MLDEDGIGHLGPHANAVFVRAAAESAREGDEAGAAGRSARVELWNLSGEPARYVPSLAEDGRLTGVVLSAAGGLVLVVRETQGATVERRTNQPNVVTCVLTRERALVAFTIERADATR